MLSRARLSSFPTSERKNRSLPVEIKVYVTSARLLSRIMCMFACAIPILSLSLGSCYLGNPNSLPFSVPADLKSLRIKNLDKCPRCQELHPIVTSSYGTYINFVLCCVDARPQAWRSLRPLSGLLCLARDTHVYLS